MRKKFKIAALTATLCAFSAVGLVACGHEHTADTEWGGSDETSHWHVCTECGEKIDSTVAAHVDEDALLYDGAKHWHKCDECDHIYGETAHTPDTGSEWHKDSTHRWRECTVCGAVVESTKEVLPEIELPQTTLTAVYSGDALSCGVVTGDAYTVTYKLNDTEVTAPVNVGVYSVTVSLNDKTNHQWKDTGTTADKEFTFTVTKKNVVAPTADETEFKCTGSEQTYTVAESDDYTVTGNKRTEAGAQTVTVVLKDKDNTQWAGGTTDDKTFTFTIFHDHKWEKDGDTEKLKCVCGDTASTLKTVVEATQNIDLDIQVESGTVALNATKNAALDLSEIGEYQSVKSVKLDETEIATSLTIPVNAFGFVYGERTLKVTVSTGDGADHEISVPVFLISKTISDKTEYGMMPVIAKAYNSDPEIWDGYFVLDKDIDYGGTEIVNVTGIDKNTWNKGFVGVLDGQGHKIDNFQIGTSDTGAANIWSANNALFGLFNGTVKNLALTGVTVRTKGSVVAAYSGNNGVIENVYVKYKEIIPWNETDSNEIATFYGSGIGENVRVRNCIVDLSELVFKSRTGTTIGQFARFLALGCIPGENASANYQNVYVIGANDTLKLFKYAKDSYYTRTDAGDHVSGVWGAYDDGLGLYLAHGNDDFTSWKNSVWTVNENSVPYYKGATVENPVFTQKADEIVAGASGTFVAKNAMIVLSDEAIAAGITVANGVVSVPAETVAGEYAVTAKSVYDASKTATVNFRVVQREIITLVNRQTVNLNASVSGTNLVASGNATLDLENHFTGNATANVRVNDTLVSELSATVAGGKVTFDVSKISTAYFGEVAMKFVFTADETEYEINVPVLVVTKVITTAEELRTLKDMATALNGGGYYKLGGNINTNGVWFNNAANPDYRIGVDTPFDGTLDGDGYALSWLNLSSWTPGGFIQNLGANGVVKNISFPSACFGGECSLIYSGSGTVENVYIKYAHLPSDAYGGNNDNWAGNGIAVFGQNSLTVKNVVADYSAVVSEMENSAKLPPQANLKLFGKFGADATVENAIAIGISKEKYSEKVVSGSDAVRVTYTDNTDNGVAFSSTGWNETYWTVSENTVTWKTK